MEKEDIPSHKPLKLRHWLQRPESGEISQEPGPGTVLSTREIQRRKRLWGSTRYRGVQRDRGLNFPKD
ncbi:MAG: hypothetical protein WCV81_04515 [Microgenomates group bacterium]